MSIYRFLRAAHPTSRQRDRRLRLDGADGKAWRPTTPGHFPRCRRKDPDGPLLSTAIGWRYQIFVNAAIPEGYPLTFHGAVSHAKNIVSSVEGDQTHDNVSVSCLSLSKLASCRIECSPCASLSRRAECMDTLVACMVQRSVEPVVRGSESCLTHGKTLLIRTCC